MPPQVSVLGCFYIILYYLYIYIIRVCTYYMHLKLMTVNHNVMVRSIKKCVIVNRHKCWFLVVFVMYVILYIHNIDNHNSVLY